VCPRQVLNSLIAIPSSLAKEALFTLLAQFNFKYSRNADGSPQKAKKSRHNLAQGSQNPPECVTSAAQKASGGLISLFESHDPEELHLACNFAVLFMQPPYETNVLNHLCREGDDKAISALKTLLCCERIMKSCHQVSSPAQLLSEDDIITKKTVLDIITTLQVWCTNKSASHAAKAITDAGKQDSLLRIFCGPPWPDIEVAEPVLTSILRCGSDDVKAQLCGLLQGDCKSMVEWVVASAACTEGDQNLSPAVADLLLAFMQVGVDLETIMGWKGVDTSSTLLESEIRLVRRLLDSLTKQIQAKERTAPFELTHEYLCLFSVLVRRSVLTLVGTPRKQPSDGETLSANGELAMRCVRAIGEHLWLKFCHDPEDLFNVCWSLATKKLGSLNLLGPASKQAFLLARDLALQINLDSSSSSITARQELALDAFFSSTPQQAYPLHFQGIAAMCLKNQFDLETMAFSDTAFKVRILNESLSISKSVLALRIVTPDSFQHRSDQGHDDNLNVDDLEKLFESGLVEPALDYLQHVLSTSVKCTSNTHVNWPVDATLILKLLMQTMRRCLKHQNIVKILTIVETSAKFDKVFRHDISRDTSGVLGMVHSALCSKEIPLVKMAMRIYDVLLHDPKLEPEPVVAISGNFPSKIYRTNAIRIMFKVMTSSPDDENLHELGIRVAYKLTSKSKDVEFSESEIEILIAAAKKWKTVDMQASSFGIQMYLSTRGEYKQRLCQQDCVDEIMAAVKKPDAELIVLQRGQGALRNAARNVMEGDGDYTQFPWREMATTTTMLMRKYKSCREMQYRGCGVLVNISSSQQGMADAAAAIVDSYGVVVQGAKTFRGDAEIQLWALHFYIQFADRASHIDVHGQKGALPVEIGKEIEDILKAHPENIELTMLVLNILDRLLCQYENHGKCFKGQSWLKPVFFLTWQALKREVSRWEDNMTTSSFKPHPMLVNDLVSNVHKMMVRNGPYGVFGKEFIKDIDEPHKLLVATGSYADANPTAFENPIGDSEFNHEMENLLKVIPQKKGSSVKLTMQSPRVKTPLRGNVRSASGT